MKPAASILGKEFNISEDKKVPISGVILVKSLVSNFGSTFSRRLCKDEEPLVGLCLKDEMYSINWYMIHVEPRIR